MSVRCSFLCGSYLCWCNLGNDFVYCKSGCCQAPAEFGFGGRVEENPLGSDHVEDSTNCLWKFRSCEGPLAYECLSVVSVAMNCKVNFHRNGRSQSECLGRASRVFGVRGILEQCAVCHGSTVSAVCHCVEF